MNKPPISKAVLSTLLSAWILLLSTAAYLPGVHEEICSEGHCHGHHKDHTNEGSGLPENSEHGCAIDLFNAGFTADIENAPLSSNFAQRNLVVVSNWETPVVHKGYTQPVRGPPLA